MNIPIGIATSAANKDGVIEVSVTGAGFFSGVDLRAGEFAYLSSDVDGYIANPHYAPFACVKKKRACPFCGQSGTHENLRGGTECAGCGAPI